MPLPIYKKEKSGNNIKNVIAIAAGKGGVGKSLVTVNLGLALSKLGYKVGILDADVYGPSIRQMLPEESLPSQNGPKINPALCHGIKMISLAYFRNSGDAVAVRAPIANGLINQFINQVNWGDLDYLLIDFPPGTGDIQLTLCQQANLTGAVIVTTPQEVAILDVRKAMHLFDQLKIPILGVVENMSYYLHPGSTEKVYMFGQGGGEKLAQEWGVSLLGKIPIDPKLCLAADTGNSIFQNDETKLLSEQFLDLAKSAIENLDEIKNKLSNSLPQFEVNWKKGD